MITTTPALCQGSVEINAGRLNEKKMEKKKQTKINE